MKFKESEKVELKKSTGELKEALSGLCAFANSGKEISAEKRLETKVVPSLSQADISSTEQVKILNFCKEPKFRNEIQEQINLKNREYFRSGILNPLIKAGLIVMTIPNKPKSSKQKYLITKKGKALLQKAALSGTQRRLRP